MCRYKNSALSTLAIVERPIRLPGGIGAWLNKLVAPAGMKHKIILVLDAITKPDNCGSLFRSALAFGVAGVLLSPRCTDPLYRKAWNAYRLQLIYRLLQAIRTSMGAVFRLPYYASEDWCTDLTQLKEGGFRVLAMHLEGSKDMAQVVSTSDTAIVVGAEYTGVSPETARLSDACVRIKMSSNMTGNNDSLNVHVAAAIVLQASFSLNCE